MSLHHSSEDQKPCLSDLLLFEVDPRWSRESVILAATATLLERGTVLEESTGVYAPLTAGGVPDAVLITPVLEQTEQQNAVVLKRGCVLSGSHLVWPAGISTEQKKTALAVLSGLGIVIEE